MTQGFPFEPWLLPRVADAVEGHEVSAALLTALQPAIAEVCARPFEARDTLALMDVAERVGLPVDHLSELSAALEAHGGRTGTFLPPICGGVAGAAAGDLRS